jgi:hypothetical protein
LQRRIFITVLHLRQTPTSFLHCSNCSEITSNQVLTAVFCFVYCTPQHSVPITTHPPSHSTLAYRSPPLNTPGTQPGSSPRCRVNSSWVSEGLMPSIFQVIWFGDVLGKQDNDASLHSLLPVLLPLLLSTTLKLSSGKERQVGEAHGHAVAQTYSQRSE